MDIFDDDIINKLLETYQYVYLTEFDHKENIRDISEGSGMDWKDCSYYPMWQRSNKALSALEDLIKKQLPTDNNKVCNIIYNICI